jgi:TPR repeat protein
METPLETKREKVINLFNDTGYDFDKILNKTSDNNIEILYNLLVNGVEPIETEIDVELCTLIGQYYHYIYDDTSTNARNKKYRKLSKKYYLIAISKGSKECMFELAYFYHHTFMSDSDKAAKYYKMAIDNGFKFNDIHINDRHAYDNDLYLIRGMLLLYMTENDNLKKQVENLQKKVKELQTMVDFQPGGPGYLDTEKHFVEMLPKKQE